MKLLNRICLCSLFVVIASCGGGGDPTTPVPTTGPQSSYPANIYPQFAPPPPLTCSAPGTSTQLAMQKLNAFWQSNVRACACDNLMLSQGCLGNGFVTSSAYGYIFYDPGFLNYLDQVSRSALPADFFIAHEFGHNIQLRLGLNPAGKGKELQADCLGGYYVGYQVRSNQVALNEVTSTFQFACSIGDPFQSPWWASTHGTCPERVAAVQQGVFGYSLGLLPGQACLY